MKESDYKVKSVAWKLLDMANPAFRPVGFSDWGKNMQADFTIKRAQNGRTIESAEQYWNRVNHELWLRRIANG